jgi:hypothetical protein
MSGTNQLLTLKLAKRLATISGMKAPTKWANPQVITALKVRTRIGGSENHRSPMT